MQLDGCIIKKGETMVYVIGVGTDDNVQIQTTGYSTLNKAIEVAKAQKEHGQRHIRIFKLVKTIN